MASVFLSFVVCRHRSRLALFVAFFIGTGATARAQAPEEPPLPPADNRAAPAADAATLDDYARRDPTVAAALELPRNTPRQKLRMPSCVPEASESASVTAWRRGVPLALTRTR